jgi:hypothetical protein
VRHNVPEGGDAIAVEQIEAVMERLTGDRAFRVKYCQDPDETLAAYRLTPDEVRAIKAGDDRLSHLVAEEKWEEFIKALCGPYPGP